MITITKKPYICSFSKNSIDFEVQTNMFYEAPFVYPGIELEIVAFPLTGEHFIVSWTNPETESTESIQLVAVNGATPSNYVAIHKIPDSAWSGTLEQYRDLVLEKLKNTPLLNGMYLAEASGTTKITLTAKQALEALVPTWSTNQATTKIDAVISSGVVVPDSRTGYQMKALIYFEADYLSGNFEIAASVNCIVDRNSLAVLDISDILNSEIENSWNEYPVPFNQELIYKAQILKRYYVKFVESWYGEILTPTAVSDIRFVHWGGVSSDDQQLGDAVTLLTNTNGFLTWWPSGKRIGANQDDWLGWMNQGEDRMVKVNLTVFGDFGTMVFTQNVFQLKKFETLIFNSSYSANDITTLYGTTSNKFSWSIADFSTDEELVNEPFTYYIDNSCLRKSVLGFNSFGIPETFTLSAEWVETNNMSATIATRSSMFGQSSLFPQSFVFDSKHQNSMKAITQLLTQKEAYRLQSIINSMICFVLEENRWFPCVLAAKQTDVLKVNEFTAQIDVEILRANENDRASFFTLQPDLIIHEGCGIESFTVQSNNLSISTYGNLKVYRDGTLIATLTWNGTNSNYAPGTAYKTEGEYRFEVEIEGCTIVKHYSYKQKVIYAEFNETGTLNLIFQASVLGTTMDIDWGDGTITGALISTSLTTISHNYTKTGKKIIKMIAPCFDKIICFKVMKNIGIVDFSAFPNLIELKYDNGPSANWYLSGSRKLYDVWFAGTPALTFDIGLQKELQFFTLDDCSISSDELDKLIYMFWKYRKVYQYQVQLNFYNLGYSASAYFMSIYSGTGDFAGEGLVSDYFWEINFA